MKNLSFLILLFPVLLSAQDFLITFSGSGESNIVSTVIVENMTQGKSLTLNGNETLHLKSTVTEISDLVYNRTGGIQFYPNPMKEFSVMEFAMVEEGVAKVELFDISGRKLTQVQNYLNPGRHSYRITGIGNGIYVLKVTAGNYSYSGKLISNKKTSEMVNITYQNTIPFNENPGVTKSAKSEILMQYNAGDALKFISTGGEHKSVKVDVISESKNIDFAFYKCTDPDNRNYATVKIGNQIWMAENLAYLPTVYPSSLGSYTEPRYYIYNYQGADVATAKNNANYTTYGVLYNWPAAKVSCPPGWHLPSDDEWKQLEMALGMTQAQADAIDWRGTDQGTQTKATRGWANNGNGTNTSGFSGLPGGDRYGNGRFRYIESYCGWWSSTEGTTGNARGRYLTYGSSNLGCYYSQMEDGFSVRCVRVDSTQSGLPNITTTAITDIKQTTATGGGNVTADGSEAIIACGVCWSTSQNPTTLNSKTSNGTGMGLFTSNLTGLTANTHYYIRAYATNSTGTVYGNVVTFTTSTDSNLTDSFTDPRDGHVYKWVKIGTQIWMAENLAYLPAVYPSSSGSYDEPRYCVYNYQGADVAAAKNNANYTTYGVLYNWPAAKVVCPPGWHLPSDDEWKQLEMALGMTQAQADAIDWRGTDQGTQMKATSGWANNGNGTNISGFSGLPGGYSYDSFDGIGYEGHWWGSTKTSYAYDWWTRDLTYGSSNVGRYDNYIEKCGFSVRCVRD